MRKIVIIAVAAILSACNVKDNHQQQKELPPSGDTIIVSEKSNLSNKLKIKVLTSELYQVKISTFGIVKAIPTHYAEIAAPFSGRITRSFVKLGQHVKVDEPVFEISSPSFYEASRIYYQAKQEMQLAKKNLKRQQDLYHNGVGIQKDLEESEVNYELHKRDFENAIASLKVFKVNPDSLVLGQPLIIRSPIAGDVVTNNIVIGQYIKEDTGPVAIVAELSKVWIVGQIKEKDISSIHISEEIEITAAALSEKIINGKIYHISDMLDEETRSVQVYIECANADHSLKPGMYVSVRFIEQPKENILIPSTAVFQKEEESFVFVDAGNGRYVKRDVKITGTGSGRLLMKSGLKPGERIVSEGGYFLLDFN
jgi:cobalt-zinc-cadmium efflux system membrane fusion protein